MWLDCANLDMVGTQSEGNQGEEEVGMLRLLVVLFSGVLLMGACELPEEDAAAPTEEPGAPEVVEDPERERRAPEREPAEPEEAERPIPDPLTYEGSGDDLLAIEPPEDGPMLVHVAGNEAGRHFAVESYTAGGDRIDLLVNTTDPYDGVVFDSGSARELEISATGPWTVTVASIRAARVVRAGEAIEGEGDNVFQIEGSPRAAAVRGNEAGRHFAIRTVDPRGLLVNTTDPYEGRVRVPANASVVVVTAVGFWSITFE
jgi:hypothetical protein